MAYTVYTSEGVVLGRTVVSETALITRIYTKEYGALTVRAENGARSTKFAPSLQVGTVGIYDFVRSRGGYRLTGVRPISTLQALYYGESQIQFIRRCCVYITRFVPDDEGAEQDLYSLLIDVLAYARTNEWSINWWNSFRLKTLQILGYVPIDTQFTDRIEMEQLLEHIEITTHL